MKNIVVYIAGPYKAESKSEVVHNILSAACAAEQVRREGLVAIVPHLESMWHEDAIPECQWLEHMLILLSRCDAFFDIRHGMKSHGTEIERTRAIELGIPVFEDFLQLIEWSENIRITE